MSMTVKRIKDTRTPRVFMHKIADIRGGVSVSTSELGSDYLREGAVLTAPDAKGICHVVKVAEVYADAAEADTEIKVKKFHNLKVGDVVMAATGGVAYAITKIDDSGKSYDVITVGTALGAIKAGGFLSEAKEESKTTTSALKYTPFCLVGTGKPIIANTNLDTDAWIIGVTKGNPLPDFIASALKGISNY